MQDSDRNIYKKARLAAGITQEAVVCMLDISVESLRAYETGMRVPPNDVVELMTIAYHNQALGLYHLRESGAAARDILPEVADRPLPEAVLRLCNLIFAFANRSNRKNLHDGRYWSYDTYKAIAERFPFWSVRQIERIVASCETQGAILVGDYNSDKTVRTKWYTLAGDAEAEYLPKTVYSNSPDGVMTVPQGIESDTPNGEMGEEQPVPFTQTVKSIKETVTTGTNPPVSPKGDGEVLFERFWKAYPNHANKEKARRAWKKLKPSLVLCRTMSAALTVQKASDAWTKDNGQFIPHAATWLNGKRWEDELEPSAPPQSDAGDGGQKWGWGA